MPKSDWGFGEAAADSTLSFEIDGKIYTRLQNYGGSIEGNTVKSEWSPCRWIKVKSEIIPTERGHIRRHTVESEIECIAYDAGYAVSNRYMENCRISSDDKSVTVENNYSVCKVISESGECRAYYATANTNLISPKTVIPAAVYKIPVGKTCFETEITEI